MLEEQRPSAQMDRFERGSLNPLWRFPSAGAAQMMANFPAAAGLNAFGRVPMLAGGLWMMGAGVATLTAATGALTFAAARAISGPPF